MFIGFDVIKVGFTSMLFAPEVYASISLSYLISLISFGEVLFNACKIVEVLMPRAI
jgi:hypothetical protein